MLFPISLENPGLIWLLNCVHSKKIVQRGVVVRKHLARAMHRLGQGRIGVEVPYPHRTIGQTRQPPSRRPEPPHNARNPPISSALGQNLHSPDSRHACAGGYQLVCTRSPPPIVRPSNGATDFRIPQTFISSYSSRRVPILPGESDCATLITRVFAEGLGHSESGFRKRTGVGM